MNLTSLRYFFVLFNLLPIMSIKKLALHIAIVAIMAKMAILAILSMAIGISNMVILGVQMNSIKK